MNIKELKKQYREGYTLPRDFYLDSSLFENEKREIIFKNWLFAGHISKIRNVGDYFLYTVAGESVIIVKTADNTYNAFINVCRHRGSRICQESAGSVKSFVCPYHAWTYNLDGKLISAKHMEPGFKRLENGLKQVRVRVMEGLIHICMDPDVPDFDSVADDIKHFFERHRLAETKVAATETVVLKANWKLVVENFWECYHCSHTHPELKKVMAYVRAGESPSYAAKAKADYEEWKEKAEGMGHLATTLKRETGVMQSVARGQIRKGFLTQSRDGKPVAPLLGDYEDFDGGYTAIQFYPYIWFVANNDHAMLARFTPLSVRETEAEVTWLVKDSAMEGVDYQVDDVTWLWKNTLGQDKEITENNQLGVESVFYEPGCLSTHEGFGEFYHWYLKQL